jgi:chaperonin GroEL (HSP60 family)
MYSVTAVVLDVMWSLMWVVLTANGQSARELMTSSMAVQVADIEKAEKEKMRAKVENIISQGLNCFVNRQLIYNFPEEIFADAGVMAIEHADFDGIERLALVTG